MKSRTWGLILAAVLVPCAGMSLMIFLPQQKAAQAEIWSEGRLVKTVSRSTDQELTVESAGGVNVITVRDGSVAVTRADCPDGYCVKRGFCDGGAQIVCLPHRLVIRFVGKQAVDGVAG